MTHTHTHTHTRRAATAGERDATFPCTGRPKSSLSSVKHQRRTGTEAEATAQHEHGPKKNTKHGPGESPDRPTDRPTDSVAAWLAHRRSP